MKIEQINNNYMNLKKKNVVLNLKLKKNDKLISFKKIKFFKYKKVSNNIVL